MIALNFISYPFAWIQPMSRNNKKERERLDFTWEARPAQAASGCHWHSTDWRSRCFDRDEIIPPAVLFASEEKSLAESLRPLFDAIWQSAGYNFDPAFEDNARKAQLA